MGLSLRSLVKKIEDVFSADTQEDQRKRLAANQPRFYADQQRAMGNLSPETNPISRIASAGYRQVVKPVERIGGNALSDIFYDIPRYAIGGLTGNRQAMENARRATVVGNWFDPLHQDPNNLGKGLRQSAGRALSDTLDAGTLVPIGGVVTRTAGRPLLREGIKQGAKIGSREAGRFGAASGLATTLQEDRPTVKSAVTNIGGGYLLGRTIGGVAGGVLPIAGASIRGGARVGKKVNADLSGKPGGYVDLANDAEYGALSQTRKMLDKERDRIMREGGNKVRLKNNDKATKSVVQEMEKVARKRSQGGYIKLPGKDETPQVGKTKAIGKDTLGRDIPDWRGATVYHSTDAKSAANITKGGFKISGDNTQMGYYGNAVSTTPNLEYTKQFGGHTVASKVDPSAKILNLNSDKDWATFQKLTDGLSVDKYRSAVTKAGYDGVYDPGAGDLFVYNPKKLSPIPTPSAQVGKMGRQISTQQNPVVRPRGGDKLETAVLGERPAVGFKQRPLGQLSEKLSIGRQTRKITQPLEGLETKAIRASLESGSRLGRTPGRFTVGLTKQVGKTPDELARLGRYQGEKQLGDVYGKSIAKSGEQAIKQGVRKEAIAAALDPELAMAKGAKAPKLTQQEVGEVGRLRKILDITHEDNFKLGLLDEAQYVKNKGKYFPRDMTKFFEDDPMRQIARNNKMELNIFKHRKDLSDIPKEVLQAAETDPYFLTALRVQQYQRNKAFKQYSDWMATNGSVSPGPRKGYVQIPDTPVYGELRGKHLLKEQAEDLQGFIYESGVAQDIVSLLNRYDRLGIRRGRKALLTIFNPGVRFGNRTFNHLMASLNGINPITFQKNWMRGSKMIKSNSPEFLEATRNGVFGSSIIQKELYRTGDIAPKQGLLKKAVKGVSETYQLVDDKAKMSAYLTFRERGLDATEAARRTQRMMQNYDMVGQFFDLGAKTPLGGNAFVRFSSELLRMIHNTAIDNPVRLATAGAALSTLVGAASALSGETAEDRKTREGRLGAPRIPFTNQSVEIQTPWGAVNVGRLLGLTTYNDLVGGVTEDVKRLTPFQSPVVKGKDGLELNPQAFNSDPLLGPVASLLMDKDFRGKSVADPENTTDAQGNKKFAEELSSGERLKNRVRFLGQSYIPLANEGDSLISAAQGKPNYYGKERSLPQAALRTVGIKVEKFGPEQAKKTRETQAYFDERDEINRELKGLPNAAQEAFRRLTGMLKTREKVPNEFEPGSDRFKKAAVYNFPEDKWKDLTSHPELYDKMEVWKKRELQRDGKPIAPEFDERLSREFRMQLINNKSLAPGEDVEADARMYSNPEWDKYQQIRDEYKAASEKYYPKRDGEFVDELVKHVSAPFPEKGAAKKAYDEAYQAYAQGQGPKPEYNDAVDADKKAYERSKWEWTNKERRARGLPPISWETWDNVSFGFQSDEEKIFNELKYGKGFGGFGFGGGGSINPESYAISPTTGGDVSVPKVSYKKPYQIKAGSTTVKKPKVSMKKLKT